MPYYRRKPEQFLCNNKVRILWDNVIKTDRSDEANRPDNIVLDKKSSKGIIIDIAVPLDKNIVRTVEKKRIYQPLAVELKDMYRLKEIETVAVVVSANGLIDVE